MYKRCRPAVQVKDRPVRYTPAVFIAAGRKTKYSFIAGAVPACAVLEYICL